MTKKAQPANGTQARKLESYHYAWLSSHPERTEAWLVGILAQGFHIHHMDGDHDNDAPENLVLIESGDHMLIHNGVKRLLWKPKLVVKKKEKSPTKKSLQKAIDRLQLKLEDAEQQKQHGIVGGHKANAKAFVNVTIGMNEPVTRLPTGITASQRREIAEFHKLIKMRA